ncbi:MAG TPA: phosphoglycerate mutase [Mizugakiibacter sp.]|nr:phosphoglycerate mutase [Mizugakiibacter sp.]
MAEVLYLLLPDRDHCRDIGSKVFSRWMARAEPLAHTVTGYLATLGGCFNWGPGAMPVAALLRQYALGEAADNIWICADPAYVQPDMGGARMLACSGFDLTDTEVGALSRVLKPLFGDAGLLLETTSSEHWQLRLPKNRPLPDFDPPEQVLGDSLLAHLPEGRYARSWQALFNEVQLVLHQHPVNRARQQQGVWPVNCLWFWGAGALPLQVSTQLDWAMGEDTKLLALASQAGVPCYRQVDMHHHFGEELAGNGLIDCTQLCSNDLGQSWQWAMTWLHAARKRELHGLGVDGRRWRLRSRDRFRFWRRGGEA